MIPKPLDKIEKADIDGLVADQVRESRFIEYKAVLPGNSNDDKKEFLADVSAFANTSGGDIVFGVTANDGVPTDAHGLADFNADATELRLQNILRTGLEPRIPQVEPRVVEGFSQGPVLILRIRKSWRGPHMVGPSDKSRFYARHSNGKHPMDASEIRSAFALSEELPEKIRRFHTERVDAIRNDKTPVALMQQPRLILHLIPFVAFTREYRLDLAAIRNQNPGFSPSASGSWDGHFNIDGRISVRVAPSGGKESLGYCQIYRSGIVELVDAHFAVNTPDRKYIPSTRVEVDLLTLLSWYLRSYQQLQVPPPAALLLCLVDVAGFELVIPKEFRQWNELTIDRPVVHLPDVIFDNLDSDEKSIAKTIRPVFDGLWNSSGYERCMVYDENGDFVARQ